MYNQDNIVRLYYDSVSVDEILKEKIKYDHFPPEEFRQLMNAYMVSYSDTENDKLYEFIDRSTDMDGHPYAGLERRSGLNVFAALEELAEQLMIMEDNRVLCQYSRLARFREITKYVEEDLLACAFLAIRHRRLGDKHYRFTWNTTIGHNNVQLNRIMERGISENHFHLYGSAPSFHLIWIYLMNRVGGKQFSETVRNIKNRPRISREHYNLSYTEDSIITRIGKAALIRIFLLCQLNGWEQESISLVQIKKILTGKVAVEDYFPEIQKWIADIHGYAILTGGSEISDYALYGIGKVPHEAGMQDNFVGERSFIYRMLEKELFERKFPWVFYQWFYAYVVIKNSVRREFIQVNETVGFENFSIYNQRKNFYCNHDNKKMIRCAVYGSMETGNIRSLELRITPADSAEKNASSIANIDMILQSAKEKPIAQADYYYVFHFTKQKDELEERDCYDNRHCRHYKKRRKLDKTANAIRDFREMYPETADRVKGIDACSQEIGCRPEVFASVFRFLSNHVVEDFPVIKLKKKLLSTCQIDDDFLHIYDVEPESIKKKEIAQLKITYHVGEDFLDVADGLRAIDEAQKFLNLQCGDRIGHATVLGLDAGDWYRSKQNTLVIPQQDYLDNVVWLYHQLTKFGIEGMSSLRVWLEKEFDFYFSEIYRPVLKGKINTLKDEEICHFDIYSYYDSWKLRGDEPELYLNEKEFDRFSDYCFGKYAINYKYSESNNVRHRKEARFLYYLYHYDWDVRNNGQKAIEKYVPPMYIKGVEAVQKVMRHEFSTFGIGIETNPSSNLSISTMQKYEDHPIIQFYNKDLSCDFNKIKECPQINVSINTDDKGVFHTSLENEYALMACALEKARDENGNRIYNRQMIYQWLDNIREMGNLQTFNDRKEK